MDEITQKIMGIVKSQPGVTSAKQNYQAYMQEVREKLNRATGDPAQLDEIEREAKASISEALFPFHVLDAAYTELNLAVEKARRGES